MSSLDQRLVARCQELRTEIAAVERALPSIEEEIAAQFAHLDSSTETFRAHPFRLLHGSGPQQVERMLLGFSGVTQPDVTRRLIEEAVRRNAGPWLRLPADRQAAELAGLKAELRQAEARLEINRRQVEASDGSTLPRDDGTDPSVWLATDGTLAAIAAGEEVPA